MSSRGAGRRQRVARAPRPLDPGACSRLLVRVPNWVGDALLATPALHALRLAFAGAEISVLAKPWVAPLFEASPDCSRPSSMSARAGTPALRV
jgi:ADP-heptose:LPS heptosyltransferase